MDNSKLVEGDGRTHLETTLMGESLINRDFVASTATDDEVAILPDAQIVSLGGRSILDRGRAAVFPIRDEIVAARAHHSLIVGVSGGARVRHVYHIGLELGIPTGGLAQLVGACEEQSAAMLQALLAKHNGIFLTRDHFTDLPLYLQNGMIPIVISVPPYHYWEPPSRTGRLPEHGSDVGIFLASEALGMKRCIFVKDQDGLFIDDPATNPKAEFIEQIGTGELMRRDLPSLIVDRVLIETLHEAHQVKEIQIVNGLVPGRLTAALNGEHAGTIIRRED